MARNGTSRSRATRANAADLVALYYLYGLERVGRLTAQRFIGEHDWYREGADHLVNEEIAGADYWKGAGLRRRQRP